MPFLKKLLASGTLALSLACTPSADSGREGNRPDCEEQNFSEQDFDRAFGGARRRMETEGYEVRSSLWEDEERFTRLLEYMVEELGCRVSDRRYGGSCAQTESLKKYMQNVHYCGPQEGSECLRPAGDCQNHVCYVHDICISDLLQSSKDRSICLWSDETATCDSNFFQGYNFCVNNNDCGFSCNLYGSIARGVTRYHKYGPGCIWSKEIKDDTEEDKTFECENSLLSTGYLWAVQGCRSGTTETLDKKCYTELQVEGSSPLPLQSLGNTFWTQQDRLAELTRDFSTSNFSACNNIGRWPQLYACAVKIEPNLYLATVNGDFCANGGLWRVSSSPWPGLMWCGEEERKRNWYSKCDAGELVGY